MYLEMHMSTLALVALGVFVVGFVWGLHIGYDNGGYDREYS